MLIRSPETADAIPVIHGRDHAALALLPFTVAAHDGTDASEPASFAYQLEIDGRIRRVNVILSPGRATPLPTHGDQLVFLALLQLALQQKHAAEGLEFRRRDLFDVLGWGSRGEHYERLQTALARLHALTITINTAMIARDGREYGRDQQGSHILDDYRIGSGHNAECRVVWGHLVREAFRLGDFKRLDWDLLLALGNPLTAQLYRLLDRVTLSGSTQWVIGWRPLAAALGMKAESYPRPARFRQVLEPHLAKLAEQKVIDSVDYRRGGEFVFHIRNYLRSELRRVLTDELGVYPDAARQLVAGFDETLIMQQADCLRFRQPPPREPAGYLVKAVREGYELRYPDDEPEAFAALWAVYSPAVQQAYHRAGMSLLGTGGSLFDSNADPQAWTVELRAVVRFLLTWGVEPEQVAPGANLPTHRG